MDAIPNLLMISGEERTGALSCHGFPAWRRDGVDFRLLSTRAIEQTESGNDRSCALLIDNHRVAALLTGDTSAQFESLLLRDVEDVIRRRLAVVLVPHHGSLTSSSRAFTRLTAPRFALVSAGHQNRYGHPHPEVVARWQQVGARVLTTGKGGALVWRSIAPGKVTALRESRPRYWRGAAST